MSTKDYRPPGRYISEGKHANPRHRKGTKFWRKVNRKKRGPKPTHSSCSGKGKEIIVIPEHTRCIDSYKAFRKAPCGQRGSRQCTGRTRTGQRCRLMVCKPQTRCRHHPARRSPVQTRAGARRTGR